MMNILIFNWRDPKNPQSGGAEIVTLEHAKAWVAKGHSVTWFASGVSGLPQKETIAGVRIIRQGNWFTVYVAAPFYYFLNKKNVDLVIDEIHGIPFFTPLYVRKPKIAFLHEVAAEIWDYMYPFPINKIGRFIEPLYFTLYKTVTFWTDAPSTIDELTQFGISKKQCHAIACPINNDSLTTVPQKEKIPTYIFVSRLVKMKGIEEIIKAFGLIHKENNKAKLWIVGRGESSYLKQLQQMVSLYGIKEQVIFFGGVSQEKKIQLLRQAHIILHASIKEGWGLVIIEAASQATPAVVYNVSGLRDSVKDGNTGIVLHENSPREMATQAVLLICDETRYVHLQKNALAWAKSLTWENATKESLSLIQKVYEEKRKK